MRLEQCGGVDALAQFQDALTGNHGGARNSAGVNQHTKNEVKTDNVRLDQTTHPRTRDSVSSKLGGNSAAYTLQKLAKKAPEFYAKVVSGEMSANAAAIVAGLRKVPHTV